MAYDPSAPTIAKRIVDDVVSTLRSIRPPDYATDLGASTEQVRTVDGDVQAFPVADVPVCAVIAQPEAHDDSHITILFSTKPISLVFGVTGNNADDAGAKLERLIAEARIALLEDTQRGGIARFTSITATNVFDASKDQRTRSAQMDLTVEYATPYEDPTTSF